MRVLFWIESFWPNVGGSEVAATTLIDAMRQRGHEFVVVTRLGGPDEPDTIDYHGVPVHRLPCDQRMFDSLPGRSNKHDPEQLARLMLLRQRVVQIKKRFRPHLVHVSLPGPSVFLHRFTEAACEKAPTLVSLHVALLHSELGAHKPAFEVTRNADWVTACSQSLLNQSRRDMPSIIARSSVIHNGLPMPTLDPAPLSMSPPRLLCAGRLVEQKGFDVAIDALALLRRTHADATLTIAGDGELRASLEQQANNLGVSDAVTFRGWVEPQRMAELINDASVVLMPSRWEPFGLVALQAGQMARPVVVSRIDGLVEVVRADESGLLVPPEDAAALADAVATLLADPQRARRMGEAGRRIAADAFSVQQNVDAYEALYERLAARPAPVQEATP